MKKLFLSFVLVLQFFCLFSQGKVLEGKTVTSKILGKNVMYSIYLPPNYDASIGRKYPVLYLLHGYSDSETAWVQFGNVDQTADKAIANGDITPMIIVMPNGELDWYVNDYSGKVRWMDMFIQEFIPSIDAAYRTRANRDYRAISGLSMGGYGAFMMSIKNPSVFGYCAGLSSAIWTSERAFIERADFKQPF